MVVVRGRAGEIQIHPELRGIDARLLDPRQRDLPGVDVVHGEQALDAAAAGHRRDQCGHPVVAMNQIRHHPRHDVVDQLALENQGDPHRFIGVIAVNLVAIIKNPVLRQVDVRFWQDFVVFPQLLLVQAENVAMEHPPVVRHRYVDVCSQLEQRGNQRCGDIRQATRFRRHPLGHVPHARGQIGDLRRDNEDSRLGWLG